MASQQLEASSVQNEVNKGRVIASGSALIVPQVENKVTISLTLLKKGLEQYPTSDFKLKIKSPKKFYEQDMNGVIEAMPVNAPENFVEVLIWAPIPDITIGSELTFELVNEVPLPGNFLVCLASIVTVLPTNVN